MNFKHKTIYGMAAIALSFTISQHAYAQKNGGNGGRSGGFRPGNASAMRTNFSPKVTTQQFKSSSQQFQVTQQQFKGGQGSKLHVSSLNSHSNMQAKKLNDSNNKPSGNKQIFAASKNSTVNKPFGGKDFAKNEPHPNAPGGFKHPGNMKPSTYKQNFCWNPGYGKNFCGTWKGCYPTWNCGWKYGCYYPCYSYPSWGWCYPTYYYGCYTPVYTCGTYCGASVASASPVFYSANVSTPESVTPLAAETTLPTPMELVQSSTTLTESNSDEVQAKASEIMENVPLVDASFIASSVLKK